MSDETLRRIEADKKLYHKVHAIKAHRALGDLLYKWRIEDLRCGLKASKEYVERILRK